MKIASIIGARPQFIKSSVISSEIAERNGISEVVIHTGQHFDNNMSDIFFEELGLSKPKYNLNINQMSYHKIINKMTHSIKNIILREEINGVMVYGDTNSTLAGSLAASILSLPIFHVEAGLRSFNRDMAEERNRIITDHLSSLLFCPNKNAVKNLSKEKINKGVIHSGDIMYDSFLKFTKKDKTHFEAQNEIKFILATIHRSENISSIDKLSNIFKNLDKIHKEIKIIMPLHPHTKKKMDEFSINSNVEFIEPVGYISMLSLLKNCNLVITDSGGLQKESYFAKKQCITVRSQTEWIELIEKDHNVLCEPQNIYEQFKRKIHLNKEFVPNIYGDGNSCKIIVDSIVSYFERK